MKLLALLIIAASLAGCETVDSEGNVTRWDSEGTLKAVDGAVKTWQEIDRYNRQQQYQHYQQPQPVGYNQFGQPIYP